jgi:hypothetical protein
MIGRKSRYGRIWPPEAEMGKEEATLMIEAPVYDVFEANARSAVEVGVRE